MTSFGKSQKEIMQIVRARSPSTRSPTMYQNSPKSFFSLDTQVKIGTLIKDEKKRYSVKVYQPQESEIEVISENGNLSNFATEREEKFVKIKFTVTANGKGAQTDAVIVKSGDQEVSRIPVFFNVVVDVDTIKRIKQLREKKQMEKLGY
ncbi:hypothetical protein SS50377_23035 [Spironucleus salmonicida]|uniref:Uncharacterized protein n=1 Tax=Spironucleus salmonicida TaxID=348837 RepID=V6LSG6_9EUKA|nr:hypothetical protein SS50377_23035 [Spironucleus salmonicida]|eukprot:EST47612.1 Hypothetical protein SS50377_12307 [Spironucleus salmonicida]